MTSVTMYIGLSVQDQNSQTTGQFALAYCSGYSPSVNDNISIGKPSSSSCIKDTGATYQPYLCYIN